MADTFPSATTTLSGTWSRRSSVANVTFEPPAGAPCPSSTVHALESPLARLDVLQETCSELVEPDATKVSDVLWEEPLYEVVRGPVVVAAIVNVVILNVPVLAPAETVTTRGSARFGSVVLKAMIAPPDGAAPERVTVQALLLLETSVVGLHCTEEIVVTPNRLKLTVCDAPL